MKTLSLFQIVLIILLNLNNIFAQSTSWIGTTDVWRTASNWTNGVPDASKDVIIGDANFTGTQQPDLGRGKGIGECKSLTVGNGVKASILDIKDGLDINGTLTIGALGTINDNNGKLNISGDWINSGTYAASGPSRRIYFIGTNQTIGGTTVSDFEKLYINSGCTVTLAQNLTISNKIYLSGTFNPTASFQVSGSGDIDIQSGGTLKIMAATLAANYNLSGSIVANTSSSVIEYGGSINQTISNTLSYNILTISGTMTKSLTGNLTILSDLFVNGGILNLSSFTADRNSSGGNLTLAAGTSLKIGGANSFPTNYSTHSLASTSTVEYNGNTQTVSNESYGNLILSSVSGTVTKNMPATALTIAGNFTTAVTAGTLSFMAGNNVNVLGHVTLGASCTFNGSTFTHSTNGNWINNGTFNGCSGNFNFNGASHMISGSGANNFGNLVINGSGSSIDQNSSLTICGNLSTAGSGTLTHVSGGTGNLTMTGSAKTISGSGISFNNLIIGAGSVTTSSTFTISGNFTTTGTFSASSGTVTFSGTGKTISGAASLQLRAITVSGSLTFNKDISISSNVNVTGSLTASGGQLIFNGTSSLSGTANIYDIRITGASTLTMGSSSTLGIAGAVTLDGGGVFSTTTNLPNTVNYNGTIAQPLVFTTFSNLTVSGGNTKTPPSALTINGNFTIGSSTTFVGGALTHSISGNWINNGTFTATGTTIQLTGSSDASITGATTFLNLTINKGASNKVTLINNISVATLAMTSGNMQTGVNTLTITSNRTGNGLITGTITRTHSYSTSTNYEFEGPNTFVNFSLIVGSITSITMIVSTTPNINFPAAASINRTYDISVTGGIMYTANLRLHYEQVELNGNVETAMTMWKYGGGPWTDNNKTSNDATDNWVSKSGITNIADLWTISEGLIKYSWTGSTSSDWSVTTNWTPNGTPTSADVVYLGDLTFTNQPTLSSASTIKKLYFQSTTASTLTLGSGGNLTVQGNIDGLWSADATHTIDVGSQTLTALSSVLLSEGIANRKINLIASTGTINISGGLTQSAAANITFSGAANLNIGGDYIYSSGTFVPGTSTVTFNGIANQEIGGLMAYNVILNKASGTALLNSATTASNNFIMTGSSLLDVNSSLSILGNIDIGTGTTLNVPSTATINIGGNWTQSGSFVPGSGIVTFNGTGSQSTVATAYNNLTVNKASGTLTLLGDLVIYGDIDIQGGTVEISTYNVTRSSSGGTATLSAGTTARFGGSGLQVSNFSNLVADPTSTIEYYTALPRILLPITYGNLILSNGGSNAKTLVGTTVIAGTLTVNSGATLDASTQTLTLSGDFTMNGTFTPSSSTVIYNGNSNVNGTIIYNHITTSGICHMITGNATVNGDFIVTATGDFDAGSNTIIAYGDVTNSGILTSNGTTTFAGTQVQTIRLINAVNSTSTGVINFNGTVSPILNSTSSPVYATVNINNTSPITASQPWTVVVAMNIASGATFNGGALTHTIYRNFSNAGTVTSSGLMNFSPSSTANVDLGINFTSTGTVRFGGSGQINLVQNNTNFESIIIANTNAAGITPTLGWSINQDIQITSGAQFNGGTFNHIVSGTWNNNGTYNGQTSTVTFNSTVGSDAILGSGANNFNHIVFDTNTVMDVTSNISMTGNFTNDATTLTFIDQTSSFVGTGLSTLGGGSSAVFGDLEVNKTGNNLKLDIDATVEGSLVLTNGVLDLNAKTLLIDNPDADGISRTSGYILSENTSFDSKVSWSIGTDMTIHTFPFGNASADYIPLDFELNSGDAGVVTMSTYATGADNLPLAPGVSTINDSENVVDRFYSIILAGETTPDADITLSASTAEVGTITSLLGQLWDSEWQPATSGQVAGATSVMIPGITTFGTWAIAGNGSTLPIELVDFSAKQIDNQIVVNWETASELNNELFEVYKSVDGKNFTKIATVKGAGTTTQQKNYTITDHHVVSGKNYYQLKQVDYDGTETISPTISTKVNFTQNKFSASIYPNPATETVNIKLNKNQSSTISTVLYDQHGKKVNHVLTSSQLEQDENQIDISHLPSGIYILQISNGLTAESLRLVVQ